MCFGFLKVIVFLFVQYRVCSLNLEFDSFSEGFLFCLVVVLSRFLQFLVGTESERQLGFVFVVVDNLGCLGSGYMLGFCVFRFQGLGGVRGWVSRGFGRQGYVGGRELYGFWAFRVLVIWRGFVGREGIVEIAFDWMFVGWFFYFYSNV